MTTVHSETYSIPVEALLSQMPMAVVMIIGIILLILKYRTAPRIAAIAVAGMGCHIAAVIIPLAMERWWYVPVASTWHQNSDSFMDDLQRIRWMISATGSFLNAAGFGMLVAAILMGMKAAREARFWAASQPAAVPREDPAKAEPN